MNQIQLEVNSSVYLTMHCTAELFYGKYFHILSCCQLKDDGYNLVVPAVLIIGHTCQIGSRKL